METVNGRMINLSQASLAIGKRRTFFDNIKRSKPKLFLYIRDMFDGDIVRGYFAYRDECQELINGYFKFYNELEYRKLISSFARYYGCSGGKLRNRALTLHDRHKMSYHVYLDLKQMLPAMDEFLEKDHAK